MTFAEEPNGFPSDPDPCVVNMTSEISTETSAYKKYRTVGVGGMRSSKAWLHPHPPLYFEQHTQRSSGRQSTIRKHLHSRTPQWLHSTLSSFIKDSSCSISDLRAWRNGWRSGVVSLLLARFPVPPITGPHSDRPSSMLLLILWLFWWLFQSLPQMQEFLKVFSFLTAPSHVYSLHREGLQQVPSHTGWSWSVKPWSNP